MTEIHDETDALQAMAQLPAEQQDALARILLAALAIVETLPEDEIKRRLALLESVQINDQVSQ